MKNLEDLFTAELKNLYALEKQIDASLPEIKSVKHEKLNKRIEKFKETNASDFEEIKKLLQKHDINPGSTTDSVAKEILTNIEEESNSRIKGVVKEAGLLASFNRLVTYKTVNYDNAYSMAKTLKIKKARKKLKKIRKKNLKHTGKFMKIARKSVYKEAL